MLVLAAAVAVAASCCRDGDESAAGLAAARPRERWSRSTRGAAPFDAASRRPDPERDRRARRAVWVVDADAQTVLRLSGSSRVVETFSTGATPTDVAAGAGSVWVANGRPLEDAQFIGPVATAVARLDPTTGTKRAELRAAAGAAARSRISSRTTWPRSKNAVWAVAPDFAVVRIDAATGAITARSTAVRAAAVAAGPAGVWVLGVDGVVGAARRTHRAAGRTRERAASSVGSIAVGTDAAWVTSPSEGTLWRIGAGQADCRRDRARPGRLGHRGRGGRRLGREPARRHRRPKVGHRVRAVERTIDLDGIPRSIAVDGGTLWVALVD